LAEQEAVCSNLESRRTNSSDLFDVFIESWDMEVFDDVLDLMVGFLSRWSPDGFLGLKPGELHIF
jgi:hypothetical protein